MTKIQTSKFKLSRRLGKSVHAHPQDAINYRNYFPGQHGQTVMRRSSEFAVQLIAKQSLKFHHNITEKQLRLYFKKAISKKGDTSENLICFLNSRLDTCIYRANLAPTFYSACQIVSHGHVRVNGKKVNIRSYILKEGDVVSLSEKAKEMALVNEIKDERKIPDYLVFDKANKSFKFIRLPALAEIPYPFKAEPNLVVEYYSR
jgi:small subunit ribosomal protein S4